MHRLQLVARQHQLLHARRAVEGALSHLLDLIVAQVSGKRRQNGSGQTRGVGTHAPCRPLETLRHPWSDGWMVGSSVLGSGSLMLGLQHLRLGERAPQSTQTGLPL